MNYKADFYHLRAVITGIALLFSLCTSAQTEAKGRVGYLSINGRLFDLSQYDQIALGSPFYLPTWQKTIMYLADDRVINTVETKLNLLDNQLHYLDSSKQEMVATNAIRSVVFNAGTATEAIFVTGNQFPTAANFPKGWTQWLTGDKAILVKQYNKTLKETKGYSSGPGEKVIETDTQLLLWHKGETQKVKTLDEVAALLGGEAVTKWMATHKGKSKNEAEIKELVQIYNSSQQ